jgi:glycine reductase
MRLIEAERPSVVFLGPAFNAGRFGLACATLGSAVARKLGIPVVSAMFPENPGVEAGHRDVYIVETSATAGGMRAALEAMAKLGLTLARDCQSARASSGADRAHGTETGYAGRRTSREDSVSVHRDGVINNISARP